MLFATLQPTSGNANGQPTGGGEIVEYGLYGSPSRPTPGPTTRVVSVADINPCEQGTLGRACADAVTRVRWSGRLSVFTRADAPPLGPAWRPTEDECDRRSDGKAPARARPTVHRLLWATTQRSSHRSAHHVDDRAYREGMARVSAGRSHRRERGRRSIWLPGYSADRTAFLAVGTMGGCSASARPPRSGVCTVAAPPLLISQCAWLSWCRLNAA